MSKRESDDETDEGFDRRSVLKAAGAAGAAGALGTGATGSAAADDYTAPPIEAQVETGITKQAATRTFPKYEYTDEDGYRQVGTATFQTLKNTGNCCENYIATTPEDWILDMGGDFLRVSKDGGETWSEISIPGPLPVTSEGAVTAAPNGDVCVMDWDPYSGDHVYSYKYDSDDETWYYAENPIYTPFYDRPWLVCLPGPFEVAGEEIPYITIQRGGYPSNDELYVSFDGLNYFYASTRLVETAVNGSVEDYLDEFPTDDAELIDWIQPHTETYINPLGGGRALADESVATAGVAFFEAGADHAILGEASDAPGGTGAAGELTWSEFDTPTGFEKTRTQTDSKGRIHQVEFPTPDEFVYRVSTDGGETFARHRQPMPGDYELAPGLALYDFKVLTDAAKNYDGPDQVAIAVHGSHDGNTGGQVPTEPEQSRRASSYPSRDVVGPADDTEPSDELRAASDDDGGVQEPDIPADQDMLFRLTNIDDEARDADPDVEVSFVGAADASYVSGVNTAERFDFQTLGIRPNGRVAMSFADTTDPNPMMAIELEEKPPVEELDRFVMPAGTREDDGSVFTGGQTNQIDLTVNPNVVPAEAARVRVRDVIPIEWDVVGGDVDESDVTEDTEAGVKRIDLGRMPADATLEVTYFVEAPSGPTATGEYSFGPAEMDFDGETHDVSGTSATYRVMGPST